MLLPITITTYREKQKTMLVVPKAKYAFNIDAFLGMTSVVLILRFHCFQNIEYLYVLSKQVG